MRSRRCCSNKFVRRLWIVPALLLVTGCRRGLGTAELDSELDAACVRSLGIVYFPHLYAPGTNQKLFVWRLGGGIEREHSLVDTPFDRIVESSLQGNRLVGLIHREIYVSDIVVADLNGHIEFR